MYAPGKVLIVGGGYSVDVDKQAYTPMNTAEVIDLTKPRRVGEQSGPCNTPGSILMRLCYQTAKCS